MSGDAQLIVTERNQPESRAVIQIVGTFRGVAAGIAACVVLSGCAPGQVGGETTTTSPAATETPSSPWDLPIEQRPALFDPCVEIPIEAIEQGVGGAVEVNESLIRHWPGELMSCSWTNQEVHVNSLSTWKPRREYLSDSNFVLRNLEYGVSGREGLLLSEAGDNSDSTCLALFFTTRGTVWLKLDLVGGLGEFKNERFYKACDALDKAITPIMSYLPPGDFR